ncbi:hypothetical protein FHR81_003046 [Actinoalloteichus hoggarensis]|nr:hypothetical protein [Actinoalloteichus hoggarensis]
MTLVHTNFPGAEPEHGYTRNDVQRTPDRTLQYRLT